MPPEVQHFESSDTEPHRLQPWERQSTYSSISSRYCCTSFCYTRSDVPLHIVLGVGTGEELNEKPLGETCDANSRNSYVPIVSLRLL